jgi:hypothetical protein
MIEHAIRSILAKHYDIKALVGDKIYYVHAVKEVTPPYITIQKVANTRLYSHQGDSGLARPRLQINAFASTYLEAKTVVEAMVWALTGFRGISEGVHIQMCLLVSEVDLPYENQLNLYGIAVDYVIYHRQIIQQEVS